MPRSIPVGRHVQDEVKAALDGHSIRSIAMQWGLDVDTLRRVADGGKVQPRTLAMLERIVDRRREADEFRGTSARMATQPTRTLAPFSWSLETIRSARDAQMRGDFKLPARLADAMKTDDALFVAFHNRIAPQSAVGALLKPARDTSRARAVREKAAAHCIAPRSVLAGINGTLADHGIAFAYVEQETNRAGTCVDFELREWPIEFVSWNNALEVLTTRTKDGPPETINHGDGRWIVFRKFDLDPWKREAAILPGALVWAAHAYGLTDWASTAKSHGQAKIVGTLPDGNAIRTATGELTSMAADFLRMIQDMINGDAGGGIAPFGATTEFLANGSSAWQVFDALVNGREKAAARIYLGTDAILGSVGGAPGVDISALFGVATTKIQGDFDAIEQGLNVGFYAPWTAINEGDSRYAPRFEYQLPDPDADDKGKQRSDAYKRMNETIADYRASGFEITQDVVNKISKDCGVEVPPALASVAGPAVKPNLAPTDVYKILTVNEMRASQGLPPLAGPEGAMFGGQFDAKNAANSDAPAVPTAPPPPASPDAPSAAPVPVTP